MDFYSSLFSAERIPFENNENSPEKYKLLQVLPVNFVMKYSSSLIN